MLGVGEGSVFLLLFYFCVLKDFVGGGGGILHRMEGTEFLFYHFIKRYFVST